MVVEADYSNAEFTNAFAADGIIPEEYGRRTVVEYRAQLHTVPTWNAQSSRDQPEDADMDMITPVGIESQRLRTITVSEDDPLPPPNHLEVDAALRRLGKALDMSGMGSLDPRCICVLRVQRPFFLGGRARPASLDQRQQGSHGVLGPISAAFTKFLSPSKPGRETEVSLLSWHWAEDLLAIATGAHLDRICAFNFQNGTWEIPGQRIRSFNGIRCMSFRPYAGRVLAIGCDEGVALLCGTKIDFLRASGHTHIVSLDWSADGTKLATASAADGTVRLWDVGTQKSIFVDKGGVVRFSRGEGSRYLFVSSSVSNYFRLWCTETWTNERWGYLSGPVAAITWSPDGMTLLFSTQGESAIHVICIGGPRVDDETRVIHTELTGLPQSGGPGGTPILLEMDSTGERLAVAYETPSDELELDGAHNEDFRQDPNRRYAVALYATQLHPNFRISPIGYISGPDASGPPVAIKFKPKSTINKAAVLSCMWRSGEVTFTQLLFTPVRQ